METAKPVSPFALLAAGALTAVLLSPCIARAVGIGEVVRQGRIGEPLFALVELRTASDENIEASCLSLSVPDPDDDEAGIYLLDAALEVRTEGARQYVVVSSRKKFNDPIAKLRLQVRCPGMGSIVKTLTILPGLDSIPSSTVAASATRTSALAYFSEGESAPKAAPPTRRRHAKTAIKKQAPQAAFRLKTSGGPIDESRIRKADTGEGVLLLARQNLRDAIEWIARIVGPQRQGNQGQGQPDGIKLEMAWLISSAVAAPTPVPSIEKAPETALTPPDPKPVVAFVNKTPVAVPDQQDNPWLKRGLLAAGLALLVVVLGLLLRRYISRRSKQAAKGRLQSQQATKEAQRALKEKRTLAFTAR